VSFPIRIDATKLFYRFFIIPGVTPTFIDSRTVQTLDLEPGDYGFQFDSGFFADFAFTVTPEGTIGYDAVFDTLLSGRDTSELDIVGLDVAIDARYVSGSGVLLVGPFTNEDWISRRTIRLVPASSYRVQQGSGVVCDFTFALNADGTFSYDPRFSAAAGGFLNGAGTPHLEFYGFPVLIDSRISIDAQAADPEPAWGVTIQPIWGMPFAKTGVLFANLLPAKGFQLQNKSAIVSTAIFDLSTEGNISFASTLPLKVDTFNGLSRLTVTGALTSTVLG
jgi:hypothetical protein